MKDLIIVGAGDFGREVYDWATASGKFRIKGFLDDNKPIGFEGVTDVRVLSNIDGYTPHATELFVVSISSPRSRLDVVEKLTRKGAQFASVTHPSAVISPSAKIGEGSIVCPHALVSSNACVGRHVILNSKAGVGHDVKVGDFSTVCSFVDLTGYASIGEGVFLGSHAVVAPKCKVASFVKVSACSFVSRSIGEECTVFGVPAKKLQ